MQYSKSIQYSHCTWSNVSIGSLAVYIYFCLFLLQISGKSYLMFIKIIEGVFLNVYFCNIHSHCTCSTTLEALPSLPLVAPMAALRAWQVSLPPSWVGSGSSRTTDTETLPSFDVCRYKKKYIFFKNIKK